jgi:hypothetical protein
MMPKGMAIVFWLISVPCAAIANFLAFRIFARLSDAGIERGGYWLREDIRLYRLYWRLAPARGWPRRTLVTAASFFAVSAAAILVAAILYWGRS